ncbi:MAG: hypothetical protein ICV79_27290, partial [Flavisolibacter sp.]|nr:hypothetical protein [Flavisolibacter sp.]
MPPIVQLSPLHYRGQESIAICFSPDKDMENNIRKIKGVRYCLAHNCWYVPMDQKHYLLLKEAVEGKATLDTTALKQYLE